MNSYQKLMSECKSEDEKNGIERFFSMMKLISSQKLHGLAVKQAQLL